MNQEKTKIERLQKSQRPIWAIIPAAGIGARMQANKPKQYIQIGNQSLIELTLNVILNFEPISGVQVCISADDHEWPSLNLQHEKLLPSTLGGATRAESVLAGLEALSSHAQADDWVMVHDAARPCLSNAILIQFTEELADHPVGGLMAMPVADTLKKADSAGNVAKTVSREKVWQAQTPQMFRFKMLKDALISAKDKNLAVTDESSAMEMAGHQVALVLGERANIKVTYPGDEEWVQSYFND